MYVPNVYRYPYHGIRGIKTDLARAVSNSCVCVCVVLFFFFLFVPAQYRVYINGTRLNYNALVYLHTKWFLNETYIYYYVCRYTCAYTYNIPDNIHIYIRNIILYVNYTRRSPDIAVVRDDDDAQQ